MAKKKVETRDKSQSFKTRPPVVAVLGHVDHGKTTLLDTIRHTQFASKEPGLITQKIGAYQVEVEAGKEKKKITFIDTPGHEIFAKMRQRGAQITDIAILVVASDDGVMPQTKESIKYLRETKTPFIVALNKIDLPTASPEKVKKQLASEGVLTEGMGGDVVCIPISAKSGKGVKELLEMILLLAEMEGLQADPEGPLSLAVVESRLDPRRGPVATVIVKNGTLRQGDTVTLGQMTAKVKGMINESGQHLLEAPPSTPVEILGLKTLPTVGEITPEEAPALGEKEKGPEQKLKIILKADTTGSLEAISASLPDSVEVIYSGVGEITESDILSAKTSKTIVIGFNVNPSLTVSKLSTSENVLLKTYNLIYELLDEINDVALALGKSQDEEEIIGKAKIIAQLHFNKDQIAGCRVMDGRIARNDLVKIMRDKEEVGKTKIKSLKLFKEDVPKVEAGTECGVFLSPALDFQVGDMLLSYKIKNRGS